jgi:CRP-like cAMP-binding protein
MQDILVTHINKFTPLTEDEAAIVLQLTETHSLRKKDYLQKKGQTSNTYNFITSGCLRCFYTDDDGNETTLLFGLENWWLNDYGSFSHRKPSHLSIQAVEDTELICIRYDVLEELLTRVPKLERYFRIISQRAVEASHRRLEFIYTMTGEERYRNFAGRFPEFVQRVPQYMLASYLGFTPEFLSKIRAKKL